MRPTKMLQVIIEKDVIIRTSNTNMYFDLKIAPLSNLDDRQCMTYIIPQGKVSLEMRMFETQ